MKRLKALIVCSVLCSPAAFGETHLVRPDGSGDFPTIQAALQAAAAGDIIELVDGTYTGEGNRDLDYLGKKVTVRSQGGDPTTCVLDVQGSEGDPHRGIHFRHDEGPGSVLAGVTIQNGWEHSGGGILCDGEASPTLRSCILQQNEATTGGGMYGGTKARLEGCTFVANTATHSGGGLRGSRSTVLWGCRFESNQARYGAGIYIRSSCSPTLERCLFRENTALHSGGAIHCELHCSPRIERCTFLENTAGYLGGGMDVSIECWPVLRRCTFWGNGAPYCGGISIGELCDVTLLNVIVAGSTEGQAIGVFESAVTLACCDLHGNAGGDWIGDIQDRYQWYGNIAEDPLFCDPAGGNLRLRMGSPCAPYGPQSGICDTMGAWPVGCDTPPVVPPVSGGLR